MLNNNTHIKLNWKKNHGIIPAIIQHSISGEVLMLGYMNQESMTITKNTGKITFFSRTKKCLWTKGETSGNTLKLVHWYSDCDHDTLLIFALPKGPTCHKNTSSCFHPAITDLSFIYELEKIISKRKNISLFNEKSYTSHLYKCGIKRVAQKVGEEGVETALAAISCSSKELIDEISDLIYHLLVLLQFKSLTLTDVIQELRSRNTTNKTN